LGAIALPLTRLAKNQTREFTPLEAIEAFIIPLVMGSIAFVMFYLAKRAPSSRLLVLGWLLGFFVIDAVALGVMGLVSLFS
jgi:hypothetical protein